VENDQRETKKTNEQTKQQNKRKKQEQGKRRHLLAAHLALRARANGVADSRALRVVALPAAHGVALRRVNKRRTNEQTSKQQREQEKQEKNEAQCKPSAPHTSTQSAQAQACY